MPNAAIVAAALTDHSAHTWSLWLDGFDVLKEPATTKRYGVDINTVSVSIKGPGASSSMTFTIDDPQKLITVSDGQQVILHRTDIDQRFFFGWVERYQIRPDFGQQGRSVTVTCIGAETLLDWAVTTVDLTFASGIAICDAVGGIVGVSSIGEIRAFVDPVNDLGSDALPIGLATGATTTAAITIPAGTTVREAINTVARITATADGLYVGTYITVDHYLGLRVFPIKSPYTAPSPNGSIIIDETTTGQIGDGLIVDVDASGIMRGVYVKGTGVSAYVSDGTGKRGQVTTLSDTTITTTAAAQRAGINYLAQYATGFRGTVRLEGGPSVPTWDAISIVRKFVLTNVETGASATYQLTGLDFEFYGLGFTGQNLTISFGGIPPSAASLLRRLTRSTLS